MENYQQDSPNDGSYVLKEQYGKLSLKYPFTPSYLEHWWSHIFKDNCIFESR